MSIRVLLFIGLFGSCSPAGQDKPTGRDVRIFKDTPVWEAALAIRDNELNELRTLIQGNQSLRFREPYYGQSLLNWSIYRDDFEAAKILIERGADPNLKSYDSTSAVIHAVDKTETRYLQLVLDNGGNPNTVADIDAPQDLRTPLIAASFKNLDNVKLLVAAGADPNFIYRTPRGNIGGENVQSALIYAFIGNRIDIIAYLLIDLGVNFNYVFNTTIDGKPLTILTYLRN